MTRTELADAIELTVPAATFNPKHLHTTTTTTTDDSIAPDHATSTDSPHYLSDTEPALHPTNTHTSTEDYGARPPYFATTLTECLFVLTTTLAIGATAVITGATLVISSSVARSLHMTSAELSWLAAASNLAGGAFLLLFGRVADLFGRRWLLIAALGSFAVLVGVAGAMRSAVGLDVLSGLIGVSCAAAVPPAIGKLGGVYRQPSWRKNRAFACFSAGNPVGFVFGGFVGGVSTGLGGWRVTFWVLGVVYAVFAVAAWFTTPGDGEQSLGGWNWETGRQFDLVGAALVVSGMGLFTASFTLTGDAEGGWRAPYVIALLVVGVALLGAFVWWQGKTRTPLMPLGVFRDRNFSIMVAALCLGNAGFTGNLFWISLLWQRIEGVSPLMVAVRLLPAGVGGIAVNAIAGLVMHRVSNKLLMIIGTASLIIASALWSAQGSDISYWALSFPALIFSVVGVDLQFTVTNMYVMSSLPPDQQSVAGGMFNTMVRLSNTIILGVSTAVYEGAGGAAEGPKSLLYRPYQATFWISLGVAFAGLLLVPFITIGTQGHKKKTP